MKEFKKYIPPLLGLGLFAGFLNGLLGAAGGIAIIFGFRALFRNKPLDGRCFYATALAVMLPLSIVTIWQYTRSGHLPEVPLFDLFLPAAIGSTLGALLLPRINPRFLKRLFAAVVLVSGIILVI